MHNTSIKNILPGGLCDHVSDQIPTTADLTIKPPAAHSNFRISLTNQPRYQDVPSFSAYLVSKQVQLRNDSIVYKIGNAYSNAANGFAPTIMVQK